RDAAEERRQKPAGRGHHRRRGIRQLAAAHTACDRVGWRVDGSVDDLLHRAAIAASVGHRAEHGRRRERQSTRRGLFRQAHLGGDVREGGRLDDGRELVQKRISHYILPGLPSSTDWRTFHFHVLPPHFVADGLDAVAGFLAYPHLFGDVHRFAEDGLF